MPEPVSLDHILAIQKQILDEMKTVRAENAAAKERDGESRQQFTFVLETVVEMAKVLNTTAHDIGFLKTDVGVLKADVGVLKESVAIIEHDVSGIKMRIDRIEKRLGR